MKEIWKDIKDWEDYYEISNLGRIRNKKTRHIRVLDKNSAGYLRVCLYNSQNKLKKKRYFVHRLVADAFIENKENKAEVNHIDSNKLNNCVNNLEWCTRQENELHAHQFGTKPFKPFIVIWDSDELEDFSTCSQLAGLVKVSKRTVMNWLQGKSCTYNKHKIRSISYK